MGVLSYSDKSGDCPLLDFTERRGTCAAQGVTAGGETFQRKSTRPLRRKDEVAAFSAPWARSWAVRVSGHGGGGGFEEHSDPEPAEDWVHGSKVGRRGH